ncbi:hypothetical protein JXM67_02290 [candidate division WOR-3 bacterium]|nr:hypothetical protein [candidate division WOR-3 bacterium]
MKYSKTPASILTLRESRTSEYDGEWNYDLWLYYKSSQGWVSEQITSTPEDFEVSGVGHFFCVDPQGYGHLAYMLYDDYNETYNIYYSRSKEPLPSGSGITEEFPEPLELKIDRFVVYLTLSEPSCIRLDIYDAAGRRTKQIASGFYPEGQHSLPLDTGGFSAGVYFVRAGAGNLQASA